MPQVLTAPAAIIMVGNVIIGKMRTVRVSENIRRGRVTGIGRLNASEVPALEFTGTVNCDFYNIDFSLHPLTRDAILRKTGNPEAWLNTVILQEIGLELHILRKAADLANFPPDGRDPAQGGTIQYVQQTFAKIPNMFITSDGFNLNEGQISGRDGTFEYLDPIYYSI